MNTKQTVERKQLEDDAVAKNEIRLRAAFLLLKGESIKAVLWAETLPTSVDNFNVDS
jgi:hypothetical protein